MTKKALIFCLKHISNFLFIITTLILISIIIFIISSLISPGIHISISREGILGFQEFWSECALLLKAFIAFITLTIASTELQKYIDLETTKTLAKLREMLCSEVNMEIHHRIINKECIIGKSNNKEIRDVDIYNYLGTLELGAIMVRRESISLEDFANQFGYRVIETMSNCHIIQNYILKEPQYYNDLTFIFEKLNKYYHNQRDTE